MSSNRKERIALAVAAAALVAAAVIVGTHADRERAQAARLRSTKTRTSATSPLVASVGSDERQDAATNADQSSPSAPQTPASSPPREHTLWREADGPAPQTAGVQWGLVDAPTRIALDRNAIAELDLGSHVAIELPGGLHFVAAVQTLTAHDNGDRTWCGHLEGYGDRYPVVFTQGDAAAFGTFATPEGLFALEATADDAVIYRDRREGLQDPNQTCEVFHD